MATEAVSLVPQMQQMDRLTRMAQSGLSPVLIQVNQQLNIMQKSEQHVVNIIEQAAKKTEEVKKKTESLSDKLKKHKEDWKTIGNAIQKALGNLDAKKALQLTIGEGLDLDGLERRLQVRLNSKELGSSMFAHLQEQALEYGLTIDSIGKSTLQFLKYSDNLKQVDGLNRIAIQLSKIGGTSFETAYNAVESAMNGDTSSLNKDFNILNSHLKDYDLSSAYTTGGTDQFISQFETMMDEINYSGGFETVFEGAKNQLDTFTQGFQTSFALAGQNAAAALAPLFTQLNAWLSSENAQVFFDRISISLQNLVQLAAVIGGFFADNWGLIEPILWGVTAALIACKAAQLLMNQALWKSPITVIVVIIGLVIGAIVQWANSVGGFSVLWDIVVNHVLWFMDLLKIGFYWAIYGILDMWDQLQMGIKGAYVAIVNWVGDLKANVLMLLQHLINGAIDIINNFIGVLNQIPGVNIQAIGHVTFGTEAQLQNEAEKQARNAEMEEYRRSIEQNMADRAANLEQMKTDAALNKAERERNIETKQAEQARAKAEEEANETARMESLANASFGGDTMAQNGPSGSKSDPYYVSDVNVDEEDADLLKKIAEMRYVQNFVTLTPTVSMSATVSGKSDIDNLKRMIEDELFYDSISSYEGYYAHL